MPAIAAAEGGARTQPRTGSGGGARRRLIGRRLTGVDQLPGGHRHDAELARLAIRIRSAVRRQAGAPPVQAAASVARAAVVVDGATVATLVPTGAAAPVSGRTEAVGLCAAVRVANTLVAECRRRQGIARASPRTRTVARAVSGHGLTDPCIARRVVRGGGVTAGTTRGRDAGRSTGSGIPARSANPAPARAGGVLTAGSTVSCGVGRLQGALACACDGASDNEDGKPRPRATGDQIATFLSRSNHHRNAGSPSDRPVIKSCR
jgi:hypothetical protein